MDKLLSLIASRVAVAVSAFAVAVAGLAGVAPTQQPSQPTFGAVIPAIVALYEDTLQDRVTSTDTTMTLVRGTDAQGNSISGFYGFIIDEGTSAQEFVTCTAAGTALTACTRGISVEDGKTSVTALKFTHRRGASIKVTNYPQLGILSRVLNGQESVPNRLYYEGHPSFVGTVASTSLVDRKYVDDTSIAGASNADTGTKGIVQIATFAQLASGTTYGSTGAFAIPQTKDLVNSKLTNHFFNAATGDSDSYVVTISGVASLSTGMEFTFIASDSNVGPATLNVNSLGAKSIFREDGSALADQDIGQQTMVKAVYNNGNYRLLDRTELPIGSISAYASISAPNGWLKADGSAVSRTTYSQLFRLVRTRYGTGDGTTTFNLPQIGGKNIIGISTNAASASFGTLGNMGGEASHSLQMAELPAQGVTFPAGANAGSGAGTNATGQYAGATTGNQTTAPLGSGNKSNVLDPYIILQYIIKY